jgi:DNA-binding transcriptional MerR regulator
MKMKQVADRLGKHDNTIRKWAQQFSDHLSPAPSKGEHRIFTDDDLRIFAFISRLSDTGMRYEEIQDALKHKMDEGTPFPPVLPTVASESSSLITQQELETRLALKDAELRELQGRLEELRHQIQQHKEEREGFVTQVSKLSEEIGRLKAELSRRKD